MPKISSSNIASCALLLSSLLAGVGACSSDESPPANEGMSGGPSGGGGNASQSMSGAAGSAAGTPTSGSGGVAGGGAAGTPSAGAPSAGSAVGGAASAGTGGVAAGGVAAGGTAGAVGSAGAAGSGPDLVSTVAGMLDGQLLVAPCLSKGSGSVCPTFSGTCPAANANDPALSGVITTDHKVTLGGDPTKTYTITLHVQGVVESKRYTGGQDQENTKTSPKGDGFCVGGAPAMGDSYNVYMLRVGSPKQDYFFNSLQKPGVSNHTTYGIDYTAKIQANGGAEIRLVAADANCSMIKNCGPMENDGSVCTAPITLGDIDSKSAAKNSSFAFDQAYNGQWVVMAVTAVSAN